jgi:hypothetical protein
LITILKGAISYLINIYGYIIIIIIKQLIVKA